MVSNCAYFKTVPGTIKCVSIGLLAITLAIGSIGTLNSEYVKNREKYRPEFTGDEVNLWREIYFLAAAAICLIVSILNLAVHAASKEIYWDRRTAICDFIYHVCSFLVLSTSGALNVVSAVRIFGINCTSDNGCQEFELKFAAGGVALISALVCGVIAAVVLTNRKYVERDGLLGDYKYVIT